MDYKAREGIVDAADVAVSERVDYKEALSEYGEIGRDVRRFSGAIAGDFASFRDIERMLNDGETDVQIHSREVRYDIDEAWVKMIEETIPHLDKVIRNPRVELKEVGDVKRIEQSRSINSQSIIDLGQHSNYVNSYDPETNMVSPARILNVTNEEDDTTYENKFINTLVRQIYFFVNYRFRKIREMVNQTVTTYEVTSDFKTPTADGKYTLSIVLTDSETEEAECDDMEDISEDSPLVHRITKIKKLIDTYMNSELIKKLGERNVVRPPITRTNILTKNKDMKACLTLWEFISSYNKPGYSAEINEYTNELSREGRDQIVSLGAFQYAAFRYEHMGEGESNEHHDDMLYDHDGLEESIDREAGQSGADGNGGLGEANPVYASRDTLTPAEREILRTLNAALEADIVYNELSLLGKDNIAGYLSLGMTIEQLREMAHQTKRRRGNI
ncbi:MAG: DUF2357 domain-containing protein [Clostridia bacterium]|nr:DUF2357 domain-containing protein [Clostridia bacterium]